MEDIRLEARINEPWYWFVIFMAFNIYCFSFFVLFFPILSDKHWKMNDDIQFWFPLRSSRRVRDDTHTVWPISYFSEVCDRVSYFSSKRTIFYNNSCLDLVLTNSKQSIKNIVICNTIDKNSTHNDTNFTFFDISLLLLLLFIITIINWS